MRVCHKGKGVPSIMDKTQESKSFKRPRGVTVIAIWLLLSAVPGIYKSVQTGWEVLLSPVATLDWTYIMCAIICATGLLLTREWARKGTIWFFVIYFWWALIVVNRMGRPSFQYLVEAQSILFMVSAEVAKRIVIALIVTYILWPVIAVLYLTYPGVKIKFDPSRREEEEEPCQS